MTKQHRFILYGRRKSRSYENESYLGRSNGLWEESSRNLCNEVKVEAESANSYTVEVSPWRIMPA